jgi:hypothetical protein
MKSTAAELRAIGIIVPQAAPSLRLAGINYRRVGFAIGLPVFIACVLDPLHFEVAQGPGAAASQRACAAHDFYPYFFDNEADARAWLRDQQELDHVPGGCQPQQ